MVPASKLQQKGLPCHAHKRRGRKAGRLDKRDEARGRGSGWALCPGKKGVSFEFAVRCGTGQVSRGGWVH